MARNKKPAPYGRWQAHLTPDMMIQDSYRLARLKHIRIGYIGVKYVPMRGTRCSYGLA